MSWEPVEEWPRASQGDVYRGAADMIVAQRSGLMPIERLLLWWHSTAELPFADVAHDVVVTTNYVYVRTRGGGEQRVRRDAIAQGRVDARRRQYSVPHGVDMVLSDRNGDDVERALEGDTAQGWSSTHAWAPWLLLLALMIAGAAFMSVENIDEGASAVAERRYNSESAYWFYACTAAWLATAAIFFFFPRRLIVDGLGLRTVRGFVGGFRSLVPIEDIRFVEVSVNAVRRNGVTTHFYPVSVRATKDDKTTFLRTFGNKERSEAIAFAQLCARTWAIELRLPAWLKSSMAQPEKDT